MEVFEDRREAGRRLGEVLAEHPLAAQADRLVVLAIPRGGLPVAVEVAAALRADALDVALARRLRVPGDPEREFGAVGHDGHADVDQGTVERLGLLEEQVDEEVEDRRGAVARRLALYRSVLPPADLAGAVVVVVDDGVASGRTARGACELARRAGAAAVLVAVPVAPLELPAGLQAAADDVVVLSRPAEFLAVSQGYRQFPQLGDDEALDLLRPFAAR